MLQQGRKNPSASEALALSGENSADDMNYERYNILVHDFVQKLPGVSSKNLARIMNKGLSMDNLITLSRVSLYTLFKRVLTHSWPVIYCFDTKLKLFFQEELLNIIENKNEADMLFSILHVKAKPANTSKEEKPFAKRKFLSKFRNNKK